MRLSSVAVGSRRAKPITDRRRVPWPTSWITLSAVPLASNALRYSPTDRQRKSMPAGTWSANPRRSSRNSSDTGAGEKPQLPTTSVVTPCRTFDSARRFSQSRQSEWECMSMKPGARTLPDACRLFPAGSRDRSPIATILSSRMPTSVRDPERPVPSMTSAPSILRSNTGQTAGACEKPSTRSHQTAVPKRRAEPPAA